MPAVPNMSKLDGQQALKGAFNESLGAMQVIPTLQMWTALNVPATATQATATKAAGGAGVCHVAHAVIVTLSCDATAQTPLKIYIRDGATGAGTILWAATVAAPANGQGGVAIPIQGVKGTANTPMTLEFSGAGVTGSQQVVTLVGYSVQDNS